ncbi:Prefoldin [Plectosphaerella plurivora]|uniref:Prefoldin n=1 Tax=Plectosphaerella plurivora TaxID=936078 RepID=A0A9P9ABH3_9PEZI|nr:Prefoldin [Plectosphaerella plurivora]
MAGVQAQLQGLSEEYQKIQTELQTTVQSRQQLEAQRQENLGVQEEFNKLKDGERIYKLVGPVLLQQDKIEAESTVQGRIEFINKEIDRQEASIKDCQAKLDKKKTEIIQLQTSAQAAAGPSQAQA